VYEPYNSKYALKCISIFKYATYVGSQLREISTATAVRTCGFSYSGNLVMYTTDMAMKRNCELRIYDLRDPDQIGESKWSM
jgi:hypothetical protein